MIFDIVVLAVLLVSAVIAFLRGFIREVLTILGVVGGLAAAYFGGPVVAPIVHGWFDSGTEEDPQKLLGIIPYDMVADAIAYGSVFIIVVIVLSIASHMLSGWAKAIGLGAVDRTLGVVFGIARGIVILALLYLPVPILFNDETRDEWFEGSRTHFYVDTTAQAMMAMVPESLKENMKGDAEKKADEMVKSTREKLQELDVLGDGLKESLAQDDENAEGYQDGQRNDLNELIEDSYNE